MSELVQSAISSAIEVGRFSCPVCSKRFRLLKEKKQHIKSMHLRGAQS